MSDQTPEPQNEEKPKSDERQLAEAAEEAGLVVLPRVTVQALCDMGVDAGKLGLLNVAKGKLILTMTVVQEVEQMVLADMRKAKSAKFRLQGAIVIAALAKAAQACAIGVNAGGLDASQKQDTRVRKRLQIAVSPPIQMPKAG